MCTQIYSRPARWGSLTKVGFVSHAGGFPAVSTGLTDLPARLFQPHPLAVSDQAEFFLLACGYLLWKPYFEEQK
jgi:hypothetical protein